ncbi:MAG: endonuclease domain-containing protein [Bacteroidota bacterium]
MTLHYNKTIEKTKRQFLRYHATEHEDFLWSHLRRRQILGVKFRRQYSVGAYVLDFYCPELKLAIEVDGKSHESTSAQRNDLERQTYLERFGIRFLRFRNDEVEYQTGNVIAAIRNDIIERQITHQQ